MERDVQPRKQAEHLRHHAATYVVGPSYGGWYMQVVRWVRRALLGDEALTYARPLDPIEHQLGSAVLFSLHVPQTHALVLL
jgi:hypothetical protein